MIQKKISIPEETCAFVRVTAKKRKIAESAVWREIIAIGHRHYVYGAPAHDADDRNNLDAKIDLILQASIQALTLGRRVAGNINEALVVQAREDAQEIMESHGGA